MKNCSNCSNFSNFSIRQEFHVKKSNYQEKSHLIQNFVSKIVQFEININNDEFINELFKYLWDQQYELDNNKNKTDSDLTIENNQFIQWNLEYIWKKTDFYSNKTKLPKQIQTIINSSDFPFLDISVYLIEPILLYFSGIVSNSESEFNEIMPEANNTSINLNNQIINTKLILLLFKGILSEKKENRQEHLLLLTNALNSCLDIASGPRGTIGSISSCITALSIYNDFFNILPNLCKTHEHSIEYLSILNKYLYILKNHQLQIVDTKDGNMNAFLKSLESNLISISELFTDNLLPLQYYDLISPILLILSDYTLLYFRNVLVLPNFDTFDLILKNIYNTLCGYSERINSVLFLSISRKIIVCVEDLLYCISESGIEINEVDNIDQGFITTLNYLKKILPKSWNYNLFEDISSCKCNDLESSRTCHKCKKVSCVIQPKEVISQILDNGNKISFDTFEAWKEWLNSNKNYLGYEKFQVEVPYVDGNEHHNLINSYNEIDLKELDELEIETAKLCSWVFSDIQVSFDV